jgi:opacity protein-like surface antigen
MKVRIVTFIAAACVFCTVSQAQEGALQHLNFSVGGGFTMPTERLGNAADIGWNVDLRGGLNITQNLAADLDFTYSNTNLNGATLAAFNEPDGGVGIWSLTFNPVLKLAPKESPIRPYITAGYGLYHRNLTLSQPNVVPVVQCDPFFGFCFGTNVGVDQVVAESSTLKSGFNAGGGLEMGSWRSAKFFAEARYHRMFTTFGQDLSYVPVTFGIRW